MRIIWTNWKLALWRERFVGPAAIISFFAFATLMDARDPTDPKAQITSLHDYPWFFILVMSFLVSGVPCAVWTQERETTAKPLSFCLPGYRKSLRGLTLLAALPWGLLLAFLEAPHLWDRAYFTQGVSPEPLHVCLRFAGVFMVGVATCMALRGSRLVLSRLQWGLLALASFPPGIAGAVLWIGIDTHVTASRVIAGAMGIAVLIFFWLRLGNMEYVARGHRSIIQDAMDKRSQTDVKTTTPSWMDGLFLTRARRCPYLGVDRYAWASLYRAFGPVFFCWKWTLAVALVLLVLLAAPFEMGGEVALLSVGLLAVMVDLPVTSSLLLPGGRRERFNATLITLLVASLFLIPLALGLLALSQVIGVMFEEGRAGFVVRLRSIWLATVLVPWMGLLQLRGYRQLRIENRASAVITIVLIMMIFPMFLDLANWRSDARLLLYAAIGLSGWLLFLLLLRYLCFRGALDGKGAKP